MDIYEDRASIFMSPTYQRVPRVWDDRKRKLLIDSILNGFELPKIYLHELVPPLKSPTGFLRYAVVDGKQRLDTIWAFMDDAFTLDASFRVFDSPSVRAGNMRYSQLATTYPTLRARFDESMLPITVISTDDESMIEILFSRLNEAVPLTAPEYRNTLGGPLPKMFRELSTHAFFEDNLPFPTGRHVYLDLAAKLVYVIDQDRFASTKKQELDRFVSKAKEQSLSNTAGYALDDFEKLKSRAETILDTMASVFLRSDPLLKGIGNITLYFNLFRLQRVEVSAIAFRTFLAVFFDEVVAARRHLRAVLSGRELDGHIDPLMAEFIRLGQSSNDGSAIRGRYEVLRRYLDGRFGLELVAPD